MADAAQRWDPAVAGGSIGTQDVEGTARVKAEELKDTVRESSTRLSTTARDWANQEADQRTTAAASQARTIANAMRQTASRLNQDGQPQAGRLTESVAERVDGLAGYLEQADGNRIASDVQDAARRNPWAFAAAGLIAGFAASRFMKASGSADVRSSRPGYTPGAHGVADEGAGALPPSPGTAETRPYGDTSRTVPREPGDAGARPTYGTPGAYGDTGSTGA